MNTLLLKILMGIVCTTSISVYGMDIETPDSSPVQQSFDKHHSKNFKKSIYSHLIHFSLGDARRYLADFKATSPIDREIVKRMYMTIDHFYTQYQRHMFTCTELKLSHIAIGEQREAGDDIVFLMNDTLVETAIKMQSDGLDMIKHIIRIVGFDYMVQFYKNAQGQNILHIAAATGNIDLIRWLFLGMNENHVIYKDTIIQALDRNGQSPLDIAIACQKDTEAIIDLLIENGAIYTVPKAPKLRVTTLVCEDEKAFLLR